MLASGNATQRKCSAVPGPSAGLRDRARLELEETAEERPGLSGGKDGRREEPPGGGLWGDPMPPRMHPPDVRIVAAELTAVAAVAAEMGRGAEATTTRHNPPPPLARACLP